MYESFLPTGPSVLALARKLFTANDVCCLLSGLFVTMRMCPAVKLFSGPSNPPLQRSTDSMMLFGMMVVSPRIWEYPYTGTPSRVNILFPAFPPRTYIEVVPSAPVVTPGIPCAHRIGSPSPIGDTTARTPSISVLM